MGFQMSEFEFQTFLGVPPPLFGAFSPNFPVLNYDAYPKFKQVFKISILQYTWNSLWLHYVIIKPH